MTNLITKEPVIKFSHKYLKMPFFVEDDDKETILIQIFVCEKKDLSEDFIDYDTEYNDENGEFKNYLLPEGKLIVLVLHTEGMHGFWTTLRRATPDKERYYRSLIGSRVKIIINSD